MENRMTIAQNAIARLAARDGVTPEYVRAQIKIAMLNGLSSDDPKIRAFWDAIPRVGALPTPEEFILYTAERVKRRARGL
jgi:hypothetical protein